LIRSTPTTGQIYGLGVEADVPIGAFATLPEPASIEVRWHLASFHACQAAAQGDWIGYGADRGDPGEETCVRASFSPGAGLYRFDYEDGTCVLVDRGGANVWASAPPGATVEDTATYLLGPVMGFVLRLRGVPCLHASAVVVDGRAIAFAGTTGSGKSTTAAAFAQQGFAVVSDDVLAIEERGREFLARPAYPRVRLWPAAVEFLFGSPDALPRITPGWDKRYLGLGRGHFHSTPVPLEAIYLLDEPGGEEAAPERLDSRAALVALLAEAYSSELLDRDMRAREFDLLSRLAARVPVLRLHRRDGVEPLRRTCESLARAHAPV
jgi:hypothetical protein